MKLEIYLRVGQIVSVNYPAQECTFRYIDKVDYVERRAPLYHPSAGLNTGIFHYIEPGTFVLVGLGQREDPKIVAVLPQAFRSQLDFSSLSTDDSPYPALREGEIAISGKRSSALTFDAQGNVRTSFGNSFDSLNFSNRKLSKLNDSIMSSSSGFHYSGRIYRDLRARLLATEKNEDKLTNDYYFNFLSRVGRDPNLGTSVITTASTLGGSKRNPAYIENKHILYDFDRDANLGTIEEEIERFGDGTETGFLEYINRRDFSLWDVLNLNIKNPNLLLERVEGTLTDIYGNILDINRKKIIFPKEDSSNTVSDRVTQLNNLALRAVKYHFEINSKKQDTGEAPINNLGSGDIPNGSLHSRWSMDVDAEGLTKVNIPSSSNLGNIPLLTRYVNQHFINDTRDADFRPVAEDNTLITEDIAHLGFGDFSGEGVTIPSEAAPFNLGEEGDIKYRTAFHDIVKTAEEALKEPAAPAIPGVGPFQPPEFEEGEDGLPFQDVVDSAASAQPVAGPTSGATGMTKTAIQTSLINSGPNANVGGRSVSANLDGSLELNIGRDVIDNKSIVLDTSGGIVSRIGKTKSESNNASIISQLDGSIFIQVGGDSVGSDDKLDDPRVKLVVKGSKGVDEIEINENAVIIKSASGGKNIVLDSSKNIVLKAAGTILLAGSTVGVHGSSDSNGDSVNPSRLIMQKGKEI